MSKVGSIVDFRIAYIAENNSTGGFSCMHGNSECIGDINQLCVMKHFSNYTYLNFFKCVDSSQIKIPYNTDSCLKSSGASDDIIQKVHTCMQGDEGRQLMRESISYTLGRCGHHPSCRSCTMWLAGEKACVEDDGRWYDCPVGHTVDQWVKSICDKYTGTDKPEACQ